MLSLSNKYSMYNFICDSVNLRLTKLKCGSQSVVDVSAPFLPFAMQSTASVDHPLNCLHNDMKLKQNSFITVS